MTEDKVFELADIHFGRGKYNRGRVIGFAHACESEGMKLATSMMRAVAKSAATESKERRDVIEDAE